MMGAAVAGNLSVHVPVAAGSKDGGWACLSVDALLSFSAT